MDSKPGATDPQPLGLSGCSSFLGPRHTQRAWCESGSLGTVQLVKQGQPPAHPTLSRSSLPSGAAGLLPVAWAGPCQPCALHKAGVRACCRQKLAAE